MKKIFFAIVAVAAITFTACDGTAKGGSDNDSIATDTTAVVEEPGANADATISALSAALESSDAEQAQSLLQKAQEYIAQLQAEGKLEEAKAYIAKIQEFIANNEEKISSLTAGNETISNLVSAVKAIPVDATEAANAAVESAKDAAADAANAAVESAKDAAADAANTAKETAKEKAGAAVDNAASAVKGKLGL